MKTVLVTILLVTLCAAELERPVRFDGQKLVWIETSKITPEQLTAINESPDFDVWSQSMEGMSVRVDGEALQSLKESGVSFNVIVDDVQSLVDTETTSLKRSRAARVGPLDLADWFSDYHRYEESVAWWKSLAEQHRDIVTFIPSIGKTHEGRDIIAIRISSGRTNSTRGKPKVTIQGLQHAREWLAKTTVEFIVHSLVNDKTAAVQDLLDRAEFVIIPVVNPDGYEYTWDTNRLWRKNRSKNARGALLTYGTDLNRNWNDHWSEGGSSSNPSSDTYHGIGPASEPEVAAVSKFLLETAKQDQTYIAGGIDYHCYSQLILRPYGWTYEDSKHEPQHKDIGDTIREIIKKVHGKSFTSQKSIALYPTSGTANDWYYGDEVKNTLGQPAYGYTIELRPSSASFNGFVQPASEILPTGEEEVEAFFAFAKYVLDNPIG